MARSRKWALSLMVLVSLIWSLPASAQEFRGSIVGKVTDSTGGVLPGVTVVVSNNDTKVAQTLITDGQGVYSARFLNVANRTVGDRASEDRRPTPTSRSAWCASHHPSPGA